ncbi:MAG: 4Fe-4S binding protein [Patescibacteria group bacterium]|jgi:pyruvate ferredoxin oxidoreductase delta subunit|nr:4Fe-4S binding protein [Patescibacteria group bacterium]
MIAKPKSSLNNKTGSWRSFRPEVDINKCVACNMCAKICPDGAIQMKKIKGNFKPKINYDYCKGCGLCAKECPVKAISMIIEEE